MRNETAWRTSALFLALGLATGVRLEAQQFGKPEPPPPAQGRSRLLTEWFSGPFLPACVSSAFGPAPCAGAWSLGAGAEGRDLAIIAGLHQARGPGFVPANRSPSSRTAVMGEHLTLRPGNRDGTSRSPIAAAGRGGGFGRPR